jgi:5-methylcytosine-specific restriction protein A
MKAARICNRPGCPNLATQRGRCEQHAIQSWQDSTRAKDLPKGWDTLRLRVLERDHYRCRIQDPRCCLGTADEVDHIDGRHDHRMINLQSVCHPCHLVKTQREASAARTARPRTRPWGGPPPRAPG